MGGVARQEDTPDAPSVRDAGMKCVDGLPLDLESVDPGLALHEGANRVVALELILALPAQLHELPPDSIADRRQLNSRAARIAGERDSLDPVVLDDGVDDQPALRVSRADQLDAEPFPDAARSPVAGDDIGRPDFALSVGGRDRHRHALLVLFEGADGVLEGDADGAEAYEALEQDPLKFRLIEGAERRMAMEAVRELTHHQRLAAGIEVANLRVHHKARRDIGKEPNLGEKAQGLGVIGDGARQAERPAIALEDGDPKASQPEQVCRHQPDGAGADDCDIELPS